MASLANYNFQLYYRVGKANINADVFLKVSWPMYKPNASGTQHQITAMAVWAIQQATLKGPASLIEACSCDLCVMDPVEDGLQVTCLTTRLAAGPAGRPHPGPGHCEDARWDLGPVSVKADQLTWAPEAPSGKQWPQVEAWHPVQNSSAKRIPGGTVPIGIASHAQGDCSGSIPWWDQPLRPGKNAQPDAWPFLLGLNGCVGTGACQEMLPVYHLQGKTAEGSHGKYVATHPWS